MAANDDIGVAIFDLAADVEDTALGVVLGSIGPDAALTPTDDDVTLQPPAAGTAQIGAIRRQLERRFLVRLGRRVRQGGYVDLAQRLGPARPGPRQRDDQAADEA